MHSLLLLIVIAGTADSSLGSDTGWISGRMIKDSAQLPDTFWVSKKPEPAKKDDVAQALVQALPEAERARAEATLGQQTSLTDTAKPLLLSGPDSMRIVRYQVKGRDPFVPLTGSEAAVQLPDVEKSVLVGVLYDPTDRIALLEDPLNAAKSYALRERDPVQNGAVLKIEQEKVTFLLTEFGISRAVTLKLSKKKPPALTPATPSHPAAVRSVTPGRRQDSPPPQEEEGL